MDERAGRRDKERYHVNASCQIRVGAGTPIQAEVTDLSEAGCACATPSVWMRSGAQVTIRIGSLGPIDATIRWVNDRQVGIEFHRPVYGPVFEHLRSLIAQASERPDRRSVNTATSYATLLRQKSA
ncbi:PilZ domain-containing protein [Croceicoccus hydrothermalis]|uniref:PilZ domain-containing protein n=1 Tax=Croceicoccus hydrothermalis TaxID=2867964 RepID=UPI001EFAF35B|nr:PilZ domain-containing protein [Croceicoccus hydrothermalis]